MKQRLQSSFRDPSGYVFSESGLIKRAVFPIYFRQYQQLRDSGFYDSLFSKKLLIPHHEISATEELIVLQPQQIPFISYPYEWSFLQYKHAALLTLKLQKLCLQNDFTLKDASAFNVTFHEGKPVFIDTLSFDFYTENQPWNAYRQFVMHFLGPLVLAKYYGLDQLKSLAIDIDGIPLKTLSKLLPARSYLNPTIFTNIHLLAKYDAKYAGNKLSSAAKSLSKTSQIRLLDSLYDYIVGLKAEQQTEWDNYYTQTNYNDSAQLIKKEITKQWFSNLEKPTLIDIGGNDGTFSRELLPEAKLLIVADIDPNAVGQNYKKATANKETVILPIVSDFLNPAAGYGFNNRERLPLLERIEKLQLSGCLALAVIHHITLSGNIPFSMSAEFFAKMAPNLLIEFPTREDSWVKYLLDSKRDFRSHFDFYNEQQFEAEYGNYFEICTRQKIDGAERILYTMKRRNRAV